MSSTHNIYNTCDDSKRTPLINFKKLNSQKVKGVKIDQNCKYVEIDLNQLDCPLEEIILTPGRMKSADEILGSNFFNILKIPIVQRHETDPPLPDSDLLKALHYYASNRLESQDWELQNKFDGSALLGFGMLVEKWAQDIVNKNTAKLFVEKYSEDVSSNTMSLDEIYGDTRNDEVEETDELE